MADFKESKAVYVAVVQIKESFLSTSVNENAVEA